MFCKKLSFLSYNPDLGPYEREPVRETAVRVVEGSRAEVEDFWIRPRQGEILASPLSRSSHLAPRTETAPTSERDTLDINFCRLEKIHPCHLSENCPRIINARTILIKVKNSFHQRGLFSAHLRHFFRARSSKEASFDPQGRT